MSKPRLEWKVTPERRHYCVVLVVDGSPKYEYSGQVRYSCWSWGTLQARFGYTKEMILVRYATALRESRPAHV